MWFVVLAGCIPDVATVSMTGTVHDAPAAEGAVVEGVTLESRDFSDEVVGTTTTAADGTFAVDVPQGVDFFLSLTKSGFLPTHFSGVGAAVDFDAGDGYPWIVPESFVEQLRSDFSACPTVADEGAIVTGEVRYWLNTDEPGTEPLVDTAEVHVVTSADDLQYDACYLDDEGNSLADGTETGASGRFAVFGLPAGVLAVEVGWHPPNGDYVSSHPQYQVLEGGVVPMYPAWAYTTVE